MRKEEWKENIKQACVDAGTYQPFFESVIDTLAQIMENRDDAHNQYVVSGSHPTIIHTNKAKEQNVVKNPILVMENELNAQALAYWKELGLTSRAWKSMPTTVVATTSGLEQLLEKLDG